MHLNAIRINFLNYAHDEKDVVNNKEIIKKCHIIKHLNCLLLLVNTHVLIILSVLSCAVFSHTLTFFCACDFNCHLTLSNQNRIFLYTRCITLKHVMSLRGLSLRHCTQATLLLSKKCRSSSEPLATQSDLTGPRLDLPLQRRTRYRSTNWPVI